MLTSESRSKRLMWTKRTFPSPGLDSIAQQSKRRFLGDKDNQFTLLTLSI